jgi:TetR/AcrR family transcriptional regulator, transcriptional repressor for nem operon
MSDIKTAIMDVAERRIRAGGFGAFSFRDIAAEVGVKSSSVHYHFPTKEELTAAVIRRYSDVVSDYLDKQLEKNPDPVRVWTKALRNPVFTDEHMCPCTVLGAAAQDLPEQVAAEVKRFFKMHKDKLIGAGLSPTKAAELMATLVGATVLANALGDGAEYDRATKERLQRREAAAA